ncbi:MAG: hypothetical protein K6G81_09030 [Lachnospiraceae bacterium]|nr:hypothetical protein [Lachnospiraceae bacterium]
MISAENDDEYGSEHIQSQETVSTPIPTPTPKPTSTPTPTPRPTPTLDVVGSGGKAFRDFLGNPSFSFFAAYKNNSDMPIRAHNMSFDYQDDDGRLLATDKLVKCIPEVIMPGQTAYFYTYYYDLSGVDYSNGFTPRFKCELEWVKEYYRIEPSEVSFKKGWSDNNVEVIGRGKNDSGKNLSWAEVGTVFFDKDENVLGFCYGPESFPNGETTTFSISGDTMSPEIKVTDIDHVKVFIQGTTW